MTRKTKAPARRIAAALALAIAMTLPAGCSLWDGVQQVDQTLDYVNEATAYVTQAQNWAETLPTMIEQAALDPAVRDELIAELQAMEARIAAFNALDAPAVAEEVHAQIAGYNESLRTEVENVLAALDEQTADLQAIGESRMMELLDQIALTADRLRAIGG